MLDVQNLSIVYNRVKPKVPAVLDIGFSLSAGESLGIIGESGCGKTSLALAVMGVIRDAEISGKVVFQGRNLLAMTPSRRRRFSWRNIAMVFQNSLEIFNPVIPLGEQMTEPLRTHLGLSAREAGDRAAELLSMTGLDPEWLDGFPHQLSGGMRQRAMMAMALGCGPDVLIVDEPTASLDPESRAAIIGLLENLRARMGFSLILISHNLPAVRQLTSRLMTLYAGRVVEYGVTADVLRNPLSPLHPGAHQRGPRLFPVQGLVGHPRRPAQGRGPNRVRLCPAMQPGRGEVPPNPAGTHRRGSGAPGGLPQGGHRDGVAGRGPDKNLCPEKKVDSGPQGASA